MFEKYQNANALAIYDRYEFIYTPTGNNPNIQIRLREPEYKIKCTGGGISVDASSRE
jgi:hypothetical protein